MRSFGDGLIRPGRQDFSLIKVFQGAYDGSELTLINNVPAGKYVYSSEAVKINDGIVYHNLSFDGNNDYISFSNRVLPIGYKKIDILIMVTGNVGQRYTIFENNHMITSTTHGDCLFIETDGSLIWASAKAVSGDRRFSIAYTGNLCDGLKHKISLLWDGTTNADMVRMYIDDMDTPVVTGTANAIETVQASYNLMIGQSSQNNYWLDGEIYSMEVQDSSSAVALYVLSEGAGTTLVDTSGNGYDGTIVSATWENVTGQVIPAISGVASANYLIVNNGGPLISYGTDIKRYAGFVSSKAVGSW